MSQHDWFDWRGSDLIIRLKLQPRASRDGFGDVQQDRIKLRITAPPVNGQGNRHLVSWLAKQFGVSKSAVSIETGHNSPLKRVRIREPRRLPSGLGLTSNT